MQKNIIVGQNPSFVAEFNTLILGQCKYDLLDFFKALNKEDKIWLGAEELSKNGKQYVKAFIGIVAEVYLYATFSKEDSDKISSRVSLKFSKKYSALQEQYVAVLNKEKVLAKDWFIYINLVLLYHYFARTQNQLANAYDFYTSYEDEQDESFINALQNGLVLFKTKLKDKLEEKLQLIEQSSCSLDVVCSSLASLINEED